MVARIGQSGVGVPVSGGFGMRADDTDAAASEAGDRCRDGPVRVCRQKVDVGVGANQNSGPSWKNRWRRCPRQLTSTMASPVGVDGGARRADVLVGVARQQTETGRGTRRGSRQGRSRDTARRCDESPDRVAVRGAGVGTPCSRSAPPGWAYSAARQAMRRTAASVLVGADEADVEAPRGWRRGAPRRPRGSLAATRGRGRPAPAAVEDCRVMRWARVAAQASCGASRAGAKRCHRFPALRLYRGSARCIAPRRRPWRVRWCRVRRRAGPARAARRRAAARRGSSSRWCRR